MEAALIGSGGPDLVQGCAKPEPFLKKPEGMHWSTYQRLLLEAKGDSSTGKHSHYCGWLSSSA